MTECRCRRDCTLGGILITLMRPVQAGGRAGWLAGWQVGLERTAGRTCNGRTLRGADVNSSHQARQLCRPGEEVVAADPIRLMSTARTELYRAGRCRPTSQSSPGISSCRLAQQGARFGYLPGSAPAVPRADYLGTHFPLPTAHCPLPTAHLPTCPLPSTHIPLIPDSRYCGTFGR